MKEAKNSFHIGFIYKGMRSQRSKYRLQGYILCHKCGLGTRPTPISFQYACGYTCGYVKSSFLKNYIIVACRIYSLLGQNPISRERESRNFR